MLDYRSVRAVIAVIRLGSFESAARELRVTQSAVSQRVKQLEKRLGTALIVRGNPCSATKEGEQLVRHFQRVEMLEHDLAAEFPRLTDPCSASERSRLRIGADPEWQGSWIVQALSGFTQDAPFLVDLVLDETVRVGDRLRAGELLAAVTREEEFVEGYSSFSLGSLPVTAVATPAFMQHHFPRGLPSAAIASAPGLATGPTDRLPHQWIKRALGADVKVSLHRLPSRRSIFDAALAGIGWGVVPVHLATDHLRSGALVELRSGTGFALPLFWQVDPVAVKQLERLTASVVQLAKKNLEQDGNT
ncbi:ArgP/LysG family DNA-binding transcriptional regulator [Neorhizobium huautlense]|uniref:ArgP/LysG family DNA-binding transcriptional regulator n=1 Tax=Neorhizobium huautlense TaxID=67774 RepID=UPI000CF99776|nr:ArgP/LysG family DNA-binding transcriptional regulator [Neorhizobium huautlense]